MHGLFIILEILSLRIVKVGRDYNPQYLSIFRIINLSMARGASGGIVVAGAIKLTSILLGDTQPNIL